MKVQRSVSSHGTLTMLSCRRAYKTGYQRQHMRLTNTWSRFPACKFPNSLQQSVLRSSLCVYDQQDNIHCGPSSCLMHLQNTCILISFKYNNVIMSTIASHITGVSFVRTTVSSGADQRKHQSSASLAFVTEIHRWPVNSPHKGPVTRKMFSYDDFIMLFQNIHLLVVHSHFLYSSKPSLTQNNRYSQQSQENIVLHDFIEQFRAQLKKAFQILVSKIHS